MAPYYGHVARHTAHHATHGERACHISSANSTQPLPQGHRTTTTWDGDRAGETQRRRNRKERRLEPVVGRNLSPLPLPKRSDRLVDRMTYSREGEVQDSVGRDEADDSPLRNQHRRSLQDHTTRDDVCSGGRSSVQPVSPRDSNQDRTVHTDTDSLTTNAGMDVDDFDDLFGTEPSLDIASSPSRRLQSDLGLHPRSLAQPETTSTPICMTNTSTSRGPDISTPTHLYAARLPPILMTKAPEAKKHPVNPYKGNDPVKRLVQNKKLRAILSDKSLPRPRKKPDRMDLRCAGRTVFR